MSEPSLAVGFGLRLELVTFGLLALANLFGYVLLLLAIEETYFPFGAALILFPLAMLDAVVILDHDTWVRAPSPSSSAPPAGAILDAWSP